MKSSIFKGHPLTDDVMKTVKGGETIKGSDKDKMNYCPNCGFHYDDIAKKNDDIFKLIDGDWYATCPNCGSKNVVE